MRKPRGSPPGQVVMERARTVFVTPDPELAERLTKLGELRFRTMNLEAKDV